MKRSTKDVTFRERFLGITVLVVVQLIVGILHVIFGFTLLSGGFSVVSYSMIPMMYTFYTLSYGLLTLFFTYLIWLGKRSGWIGTVAVSLFVIIVDIFGIRLVECFRYSRSKSCCNWRDSFWHSDSSLPSSISCQIKIWYLMDAQ